MRRFLSSLGRAVLIGALLFLLLQASPVMGEVSVSFSPSAPRAGDCVDIIVDPGEDAAGVQYRLFAGTEKVFASRNAVSRFTVSFRPRKETVYTVEITVLRSGKRKEIVSVAIPVSDAAPEQRGEDVIYSQMDGWWRKFYYAKEYRRTLESSGCAVFAVSEALQRLGIESDAALPDALARVYHKCYIEGVGTGTEALVTQTGLDFGFDTQHLPVRAEDELVSFLKRGDPFCLGIVTGHVVLADGFDEESMKVHIADSAPGITFSKLKSTQAYIRSEDGTWQTVRSADEIPGIRWYFETAQFGGAGYWLDLKDCAARGMRLIRRPWLTLTAENGETAVSADWFGTAQSSVIVGGEARTVSTDSLYWFCDGADKPQLAVVTRERGATLTRRNGQAVGNYLPIPWGQVLCALRTDEERVYVYWRGVFGYLKRSEVELTGVPEQVFPAAVVTAEGKPAGTVIKSRRQADEKSAVAAEWPVGTEVIVLSRTDGWCFAEGTGRRGWIPEKNLAFVPDSRE